MDTFMNNKITNALKGLKDIEKNLPSCKNSIESKFSISDNDLDNYRVFRAILLDRYVVLYHACVDEIATDDELEEYLILKHSLGVFSESTNILELANENHYKKIRAAIQKGSTNEEALELRSNFKILD